MLCSGAMDLEKFLDGRRVEYWEACNPDSPSRKHLSRQEKVALREEAKEKLKTAYDARRDHDLICEVCGNILV
jgi:hypothetical protein